MKSNVSVAEKKSFIHWFLENYDLQKKEAAWLLGYLHSNDRLLEKVRFVDHVRNLPKSMIISSCCSKMVPFRFTKCIRMWRRLLTISGRIPMKSYISVCILKSVSRVPNLPRYWRFIPWRNMTWCKTIC
ncbi:YpiB family protein [Thermoactinomyces intermedius]|uniref:YpiB family protein n=1 Tax=Thermoactinomyces intermedius TaxID=2024 RepID=UPI00286891B5|nr:YpiB family protein [Thermoactinomyces intermedius]